MIDVNKIIENRIRLRENNNRKELLENEIKRINHMNSEIGEKCEHGIIIYYGKEAEIRFECFSCGVKSSCYEQDGCTDEEYIKSLQNDGKIVLDVSKYLSVIKKDMLFRVIENELAEMLNENRMDIKSISFNLDKKIRILKKFFNN